MKIDFIIIGAKKCATTTLAAHLDNHPGILTSSPKEPEFFLLANPSRRDWMRYCDCFHTGKESPSKSFLRGEASVMYTMPPLHTDAAIRIHKHNSHIKLIYMLRDPVERMRSQYQHEYLYGRIRTSPEAAIAHDACFINASHYKPIIESYLTYFDRTQIHIGIFEDFIANPPAFTKSVLSFLDVDPDIFPKVLPVAKNVTKSRYYWPNIPGIQFSRRLFQNYVPQNFREQLKMTPVFRQTRPIPSFSKSLMENLRSSFEEDIAYVRDWLGRDLREWDSLSSH